MAETQSSKTMAHLQQTHLDEKMSNLHINETLKTNNNNSWDNYVECCRNGDLTLLQELEEEVFNLHENRIFGLYVAMSYDNVETVRFLMGIESVRKSIMLHDYDMEDVLGDSMYDDAEETNGVVVSSIIQYGIFYNSKKCIRLLLDMGVVDNDALTFVVVGGFGSESEIAILLKQYGMKFDVEKLNTCFSTSSVSNIDVLRDLLKCGVDINYVSGNYTRLMSTCFDDNDVVAKFLIDSGADVNFKNSQGETVFSLAKRTGATKCLELLKSIQSDRN